MDAIIVLPSLFISIFSARWDRLQITFSNCLLPSLIIAEESNFCDFDHPNSNEIAQDIAVEQIEEFISQ